MRTKKTKEILNKINTYDWNSYCDLSELCKKYIDYDAEDKSIMYEYIAFTMSVNYKEHSDRGTHYWPFIVTKNGDWTFRESPSKSFITNETIEYWKKRVDECENVFIKFKYLDIIVDLKELITWNKAKYETIIDLIHTWIQCIEEQEIEPIKWIMILPRILNLIIWLNKQNDFKSFCQLVVDYENQHWEDSLPWLWWFSYDLLVDNRKIILDQEIEQDIIDSLEGRFERCNMFHFIEKSWLRLASYYKNKWNDKELLRVLLRIKTVYYNAIVDPKDWMRIMHVFQKLIEIFESFQEVKYIYDEKNVIINDYQEMSKKATIQFQKFRQEYTVSKEEVKARQELLQWYFEDDKYILPKICLNHVINIDISKQQLEEEIKDFSISNIFTEVSIDSNGIPINTVKTPKQKLYKHMSQDLRMKSILLGEVLKEFTDQKTSNEVLQTFIDHNLLEWNESTIFDWILSNYYEARYYDFNSMVIPFIEILLRRINYRNWITIIRYKKGDYEYLSLDYLITSWVIKRTFWERWEDFELYFQIVLTSKDWFNLRNKLAHGLNLEMFTRKDIADRLFHVLLCLSQIQFKEQYE